MKKLLFLLIAIFALSACKTKYVTVPEVRERIVNRTDTMHSHDSIYVHDSVTVTHWGDTVHIDRFHTIYKDRWRYKVKVDSFVQRDTVTVIKEIPAEPSFFAQIKNVFIVIIIAASVLAGFLVIKYVLRLVNTKF